jgi:Na+/proline symporter
MMVDMAERTEFGGEGAEVPRRGGFGGGMRPTKRGDASDGTPGSFDVRNSWQVVAGSILIPLGVVFILIAWYGAAHARVEQQQIPYMVSGAFAGLGCMVVGGLLYWGHWLYRIYDQAELHHEEQQRMMLELVRAIHSTGSAGAASVASVASVASGGASSYMATSSGTVYHKADCPVIAHHPNDLRVLSASELGGLRPCQICSPDGP